MLSILEAIGIIALAITGAAEGDILLGVHPPLGLLTLWYLVACAVTVILVFLCYPWLATLKTVIQFADAIALGMFTVTGASAAIQHGAPAYTVAAVGLATE